MRNAFDGNWMTISLMCVLLLLASAVGRVTATSVGTWLSTAAAPSHAAGAAPSGNLDAALLTAWRSR